MSDLPHRLAQGVQRVVIRTFGDRPAEELRQAIERGRVHVKFTGTRGGTEVGVRLEPERTDLSRADVATGSGTVHLEGRLSLDGVAVRCIADVDVATREGTGRLEILPADAT
jgi:hypothetical protein